MIKFLKNQWEPREDKVWGCKGPQILHSPKVRPGQLDIYSSDRLRKLLLDYILYYSSFREVC